MEVTRTLENGLYRSTSGALYNVCGQNATRFGLGDVRSGKYQAYFDIDPETGERGTRIQIPLLDGNGRICGDASGIVTKVEPKDAKQVLRLAIRKLTQSRESTELLNQIFLTKHFFGSTLHIF